MFDGNSGKATMYRSLGINGLGAHQEFGETRVVDILSLVVKETKKVLIVATVRNRGF